MAATNDLINELGQNFIEYAVAVNSDRAIPDARTGLKPVAKRILWGAYNMGASSNKPHVKSATIVGEVMGKFHPHGDSSIYEAMARLSQDFVMRYPLINWHGSNGNVLGAGPASSRYTEARLSKISEDGLLYNIKKKNVDFGLNFSDTEEEPLTLPSVFPNLLCNPNAGIGVSVACSWAPHALTEVAQAINDYIAGNEPMLPGPDFPTGGVVINKNDIPNIMKTGHGSVKIRGKYEIDKNQIIFTEIPYGTNIEALIKEIGESCDSKAIEGITEIQNQSSNKKGIRLVFICDKSHSPEVVVRQLFAKSNLQTSFSYNQVALINKTPTELNLKDCCEIYVKHNISCIKKEAEFDLTEKTNRLHIVDGLLIALEDIDNVIKLIKEAKDSSDAKEKLIGKYKLSEIQAKSILAMRLSTLAHLGKIELQNEKADLEKAVNELNIILNSNERQKEIVKERLAAIVKKYGDKRRTELLQIDEPKTKEEKEIAAVIPEKCVVVMTEAGNIKRVPAASFKQQRRNGKGIKNKNDIINAAIRTNTVDSLLIFSDKGKMYRIIVNDIPEGTNSVKGTSIKSLIDMDSNETPVLIYSIYRDTDATNLIFVTKNGLVKKTSLEEYTKTRKKTGLEAIKLKEGDSLVSVNLIKDEDIIILTKNGMGIRFDSTSVSATSRATSGTKGINIKPDDEVISMLVLRNPDDDVAVFAANGMGNRFKASELTRQARGGKGLNCYKPGNLAAAALVCDEDLLLVTGGNSSICISAKDMAKTSRGGVGTQIIKGSNITAVTKV